MKYFKDANGKPHALAVDGSQDYLIEQLGLEPIDAEEMAELLNQPSQPLSIIEQIRALEDAHENDQRRMTRITALAVAMDKGRELMIAMLVSQGATELEAKAAATDSAVHAQLMTREKGYKAMYLLEQQIEALRDQLP